MKTSHLIAIPFVTTLGTVALVQATAAEPFNLDPSHTVLTFEINHLGFSTTVGTFRDISADLDIDVDDPTKSEATFMIKAASIDTNWPARDEHLRSKDFFNVEVHEDITFSVTSVNQTSDTEAMVTGDLTMLGVTKPVEFAAQLNGWGKHPFRENNVIGFTATGDIQRSEWGLEMFSPAVGETVTLTLNFEATPAS